MTHEPPERVFDPKNFIGGASNANDRLMGVEESDINPQIPLADQGESLGDYIIRLQDLNKKAQQSMRTVVEQAWEAAYAEAKVRQQNRSEKKIGEQKPETAGHKIAQLMTELAKSGDQPIQKMVENAVASSQSVLSGMKSILGPKPASTEKFYIPPADQNDWPRMTPEQRLRALLTNKDFRSSYSFFPREEMSTEGDSRVTKYDKEIIILSREVFPGVPRDDYQNYQDSLLKRLGVLGDDQKEVDLKTELTKKFTKSREITSSGNTILEKKYLLFFGSDNQITAVTVETNIPGLFVRIDFGDDFVRFYLDNSALLNTISNVKN